MHVRDVAIYLRKSRDEETEADVLYKHRAVLLDLVKQKGWTLVEIYQEIGIRVYRRATRDAKAVQ